MDKIRSPCVGHFLLPEMVGMHPPLGGETKLRRHILQITDLADDVLRDKELTRGRCLFTKCRAFRQTERQDLALKHGFPLTG